MSEVRRLADGEAVSHAAADTFVELARRARDERGRFRVALSGGSTPRRMYELLGTEPYRSAVRWDTVEFFWGDERAVPPEHPDSNYGMAAAALLDPLAIGADQRHRMRADAADLEQAARAYQQEIAGVFAVAADGAPPAFDLILLGMGPDGHTASLFPYGEALPERRRWVMSPFVARLSQRRMTLTPPILNRARDIRFLVSGSDKAPVLQQALEGPRDPERLPVQLVVPESGRLIWLVDDTAAARLTAR